MSDIIKKINNKLTRVKLTDKLFFTKNLSLMIKSGIPLIDALDSLTKQTDNINLQSVLQSMSQQVKKGTSLSGAMSEHRPVFSDIFTNMVQAGEESGNLDEALKTLTIQMHKEHDLKSKVRGALAYPVVVLVAMVSIVIGLMIFVIPKMVSMFTSSGMELPLPTKILIKTSTFMANYYYILFLVLIIAIFAFVRFKKTATGQHILHGLILYLPIISTLSRKLNIARACRALASLLKTDVPVVDAFVIASNVLNNVYFKEALLVVSKKLKTGKQIHEALQQFPTLFPATILQMVLAGEQTGTLDTMLHEIAEFYEGDLDNSLKNLPSLLEPILILILGVTVGGIAISIMLPIFKLTEGAGG